MTAFILALLLSASVAPAVSGPLMLPTANGPAAAMAVTTTLLVCLMPPPPARLSRAVMRKFMRRVPLLGFGRISPEKNGALLDVGSHGILVGGMFWLSRMYCSDGNSRVGDVVGLNERNSGAVPLSPVVLGPPCVPTSTCSQL